TSSIGLSNTVCRILRNNRSVDSVISIFRYSILWDPGCAGLGYALRRALQIEYQIEEREVAVELIGREENESLLFWEAAEGGIGVWERLIAEPREFRTLAARALEVLHFDPATGQAFPEGRTVHRRLLRLSLELFESTGS